MGTRERQERERIKVRQAILDAARDLFVEQGFEHVSIRKVAERIEYSPAAIYSYFPSKDEIFFALAEEGFRLLASDFLEQPEVLPVGVDPLETIRHICLHFYTFSIEHPEHFALMFLDRTVPRLGTQYELFPMIVEMKRRFAEVIRIATEQGHFPADSNPHTISRVLMTTMLGVATARLCNRMGGRDGADALARDMIEVVLAGVKAGVTFTAPGALMDEEVSVHPCLQDEAAWESGKAVPSRLTSKTGDDESNNRGDQ
jgi:AcrR family transcriptional regulator